MKPGTVELDPAQQAAANALEALLDPSGRPPARGGTHPGRPAERGNGRAGPFGFSLRGRRAEGGNPPAGRSGIYLHGRPGRGKTMVMDRFFATADTFRKRRLHFHTFFAALHTATHALGSIERAIDELLGDADLVCFDEFHVTDIGDAMLIARMLDTLFADQRTLVVTSNYRPQDLLPNPLFHDHFLPTIERIRTNLQIVTLDGPLDYRTRSAHRDTGFLAGRYVLTAADTGRVTPGASLDAGVAAHPSALHVGADPAVSRGAATNVDLGNGRSIRAHTTGNTITVDFRHLCAAPTSAADYLHLASRYRRWTLHSVPSLREVPPDWSMRLVNLIDVLYDADLPFTIHAPEPAHELTTGVPAIPDLARTASRLGELSLVGAAIIRPA